MSISFDHQQGAWRRGVAALAAVAALGVGASAHALTGSTTDVEVAPGGQATVVLNLDFGTPGSLVGAFDLELTYFQAELTPTNFIPKIEFDGVPPNLAVGTFVPGFDFSGPQAKISATWTVASLANFQTFAGTARVSMTFNTPGLLLGESTPVTVGIGYSELVDGDLVEVPFTTWTSTVTAVPEPTTVASLLAGLGVLGVVARRKAQRQA